MGIIGVNMKYSLWKKFLDDKNHAFDYFMNLESEHLPKSGSSFLYDKRYYESIGYRTLNPKRTENIIFVKGTPFYYKPWKNEYSINSITSSEMYNKCGLITPPVYKLSSRKSYEISQDVNSIKDGTSVIAKNIPELGKIRKTFNLESYKWSLLYDKDIRDAFLEFMTPECFEEFVLMFILAELRTDVDLHPQNYFLFKHKLAEKFEKAIPIDLELSRILDYTNRESSSFKDFLFRNYDSYSPHMAVDGYANYRDRIYNLREVIADSVLSKNQIDVIKKCLAYNFAEQFRENFRKLNEKGNFLDVYELFANLWEYNRNNLGRELDL